MERLIDEATLEQLSAMWVATDENPVPENVQRMAALVKQYSDRVGSGAPLPANILAMICVLGSQEATPVKAPQGSKAPAKKLAVAAEARVTPQESRMDYASMSLSELRLLAGDKDIEPSLDKDELVHLLEQSDKAK